MDIGELWQVHKNKDVLVCGTGPSIRMLPEQHRYLTIGVNDIGRFFNPSYLLLMDKPETFETDLERNHDVPATETRLATILCTYPTHGVVVAGYAGLWVEVLGDDFWRAKVSIFDAKKKIGPWHDRLAHRSYYLHRYASSTLTAASLAGFMGARKVGLIGVDCFDHPNLEEGNFELWDNHGYGPYYDWLLKQGIQMVNLSPVSQLKSIPHESMEEWGIEPVDVGEPSQSAQG